MKELIYFVLYWKRKKYVFPTS